MPRAPGDPATRFLAKVKKTESCWLWTGSTNNKGYGWFRLNGKTHLAHRVAFVLANQAKTLPPGMSICVLHRCDNRLCVRPEHLFLGSPQDNTDDMMKKGRWRMPRHIAAAVAKRREIECHKEL